MYKRTLILLRGIPGSGKTTLADAITIAEDSIAISADDYFMVDREYVFDRTKLKDAHQYCQYRVDMAMGAYDYRQIVVHNTFSQEWEMQPYFDLADSYGYEVHVCVVENWGRPERKSVHDVPDSTIEKMRSRFEVRL